MNYTSNHHLPQWSDSDRVRMDDFNSAMAAIDSSITSAQSAAASAKSTASTASTNAASAKSTAAAALEKAEAAYSPDNLPYVIGTYTGGTTTQKVQLGFMPSFLIITGMQFSKDPDDTTPFDRYFAMIGSNGTIVGQQLQYRVQLTPTGFYAFPEGNLGSYLPNMNEPDRTYYYIAFR